MKVNRKWAVGHSYGYVGTDSKEVVDIVDMGIATEEDLEDMTEEAYQELLKHMQEMEWEAALERVDAWAHPVEEGDKE